MQNDTEANERPESVRKRSRQACEPCKLRKRRCDGKMPCDSCQRYRYGCYYSSPWRRRSKKVLSVDGDNNEEIDNDQDPTDGSDPNLTKSGSGGPVVDLSIRGKTEELSPETNSGISFPQLVGRSLSPGNVLNLQGLGWNLGHHYAPSFSTKSITDLVSKDEWLGLFAVYVQKIHSVYSFLDLAIVHSKSAYRWDNASATNSYDHVLCGIAALACLFSPGPVDFREQIFLEYAQDLLHSTSYEHQPGPHEVQAALLRLLYVRANCPPHAAWMASGLTMQILESSGLHKEDMDILSTDSHGTPEPIDPECRRKTYWLAKLLNTWISNEYGRTPFRMIGASCRLPTASSGDPMAAFLAMLQVSAVLQSDKIPDVGELEAAINKVEQYTFATDCLILSKANLCFTLYRRLRLVTGNINPDLLNTIIVIGVEGLKASSRAIQAWTPWWHVSNIPFQFTCILLAMDTPEALSHVAEAVTTLRLATNTFRSPVVQTALATIEQLVALSHKRKQQGVVSLAGVLLNQHDENGQDASSNHIVDPFPLMSTDAWPSELLWTGPTLDNVDWDRIWDDTMPVGRH